MYVRRKIGNFIIIIIITFYNMWTIYDDRQRVQSLYKMKYKKHETVKYKNYNAKC